MSDMGMKNGKKAEVDRRETNEKFICKAFFLILAASHSLLSPVSIINYMESCISLDLPSSFNSEFPFRVRRSQKALVFVHVL